MNNLTSQQRKLVYMGGIVLMLIVTIFLGRPATSETDEGGKISQLRISEELGESTLGNVDPSSATMNLVLLGMRGVAVNVLWMEHENYKTTKRFAEMRNTVDSIIALQPHYLGVWRYHAWDLAYNISAQWDDVRDRFYWVKQGAKFGLTGAERNKKYPELPWVVGRMTGQKIGQSDEWRYFRRYFNEADPDPKWEGRPDKELNELEEDNYKVARRHFIEANRRDSEARRLKTNFRQHIMDQALFYHYPQRAVFDFADALYREGHFDETAQLAWSEAFDEWVNKYGQMVFEVPIGDEIPYHVMLEPDEDDIARLAKQDNTTPEVIRYWVGRYQNMTNYRYWRARARVEKEDDMVRAHRQMYLGRVAYKQGKHVYPSDGSKPEAVERLENGMRLFSQQLLKFNDENSEQKDDLTTDDNMIDEGLLAVMFWRKALQENGKPIPDEYSLKWLWDAHESRHQDIENEFRRELRTVE